MNYQKIYDAQQVLSRIKKRCDERAASHERPIEKWPSPRHFEEGLMGRCPRCDTDGPCIFGKGSIGSADWDFQEGDTCYDRPFKDGETAFAYLTHNYFCNSGALLSFWDGDRLQWMHERIVITDERPSAAWPLYIQELQRELRLHKDNPHHAELIRRHIKKDLL